MKVVSSPSKILSNTVRPSWKQTLSCSYRKRVPRWSVMVTKSSLVTCLRLANSRSSLYHRRPSEEALVLHTCAPIDTSTYIPSTNKISVRATGCQYLRMRIHQKQHKRAKALHVTSKTERRQLHQAWFKVHWQSCALRERPELENKSVADSE